MKRTVLFAAFTMICAMQLNAQVTQINSNKSLQPIVPLVANRTIVVSEIDSSIWVTDGTLAGTVQISPNVKFEYTWGILNSKLVFRGSTPATGSEIYITDGTPGGTVLVKDIVAGAEGSDAGEMVELNGFLYFTAVTAAEGRELWRTDGTAGGTTFVKDIYPGPENSNEIDEYNLYSNGSFLLFAARTASNGIELWKSDGTNAGTTLLSDINTGADSSNPRDFFTFNNLVLFIATDAAHGSEIWKTDGTPGGTVILKDINPGTPSSTAFTIEIVPGQPQEFPYFLGFHVYNNHAFFNVNDGTSNGGIWSTDGTTANTVLIKDILPGTSLSSLILLIDAVNLSNKFIFPVTDGTTRAELWESDGTPGGTQLFKAFEPIDGGTTPFVFLNLNFNQVNGTITYPLFQGNKFFFSAASGDAEGYELWISDGTVGGTHIVRDIYTGGNGIDQTASLSYIYTSTTLFFAGNGGTNGDEVWKSDGTTGGTTQVFDINPGANGSDPLFAFNAFGKILFTATDGDDPDNTDLYVIDGLFSPLPVELAKFTATPVNTDAILNWATAQEANTKDFTVQRSDDGQNFENIGIVAAAGNSSARREYAFIDASIVSSGKNVVYYRLLITDKDGKSKTSKVISLKLKGTADWSIKVLSNPVHNDLSVALGGITEGVKLSIRDITGKVVYSNSLQSVNGQITLPTAGLQNGSYFLVAETQNQRKTVKFLKQ